MLNDMTWVRFCHLFRVSCSNLSLLDYQTCPDNSPSLPPGDGSTVILRNSENTLTRISESVGGECHRCRRSFLTFVIYAADFLKQRTFQGLEQRLGEDAPSVLEQGRSGIARGYLDDHLPPEDVLR